LLIGTVSREAGWVGRSLPPLLSDDLASR